jgi:predicted TIM-barrel fold metal-dependent hydrolase
MTHAIDLFVNPNMAALANDRLVRDLNESTFRAENLFRDISAGELLASMNDAGVEHAVISVDAENPKDWILDFSRSHPERFSLAAWVNIDRGMDAVWAMRDLAQREKIVMARVMPSMHDKPPAHASYYPLFAKCAEMDLPVSVLTGIPGPRLDAASQDPIHLDRVCRDFPMLTVIMTHGADPWWDTAIRLMMKYPRLFLMTSAWLPKYLPASLISYMNTRGREKIMWASDHPVIDMKRSLRAVSGLDLRDGVKERYLSENARSVFRL